MTRYNSFSYQFYALHGFLGHAEDWIPFEQINHPMVIQREDLDFWQWSHHFNSEVSFKKNKGKNILLGYSMGGRLAMHVLLANPSLWDAAIFVSAHPGLHDLEAKRNRLEMDDRWADRFESSSWNALMDEWNANPVFGGKKPPFIRKEINYDRKILAQQLRQWSLGKQEYLLNELMQIKVPMLYIAGKFDVNCCLIAEEFQSFAKAVIIPEVAHRVPWEAPEAFSYVINQFKEGL